MKKLTVLSIVAASLLLVGCGDSATGAEAKAATEHKTESTMKCGEGKCGAAMKEKAEKVVTETKSAATEAKEAAAVAVEKTKEAVTEKATAAVDAAKAAASEATAAVTEKAAAVTEKATAAVDAAKESASSAVDSAKAAAASAATAATAAVAAATESGPDGKALFAKCAGCHGADGHTKALGKSAVIAGQAAADLETKIAGYKAGTLNVSGMGALMKGQVASMSDADIKAISAYISGL